MHRAVKSAQTIPPQKGDDQQPDIQSQGDGRDPDWRPSRNPGAVVGASTPPARPRPGKRPRGATKAKRIG